jgi:protein kinase A
VADLSKRFGNLKSGAEDIKKHKWFSDIDWVKLVNLEITPPYVPNVKHAGKMMMLLSMHILLNSNHLNVKGDASNFDVYEEESEPYGKPGTDPYAEKFADF